jgi:putative DNA methylase
VTDTNNRRMIDVWFPCAAVDEACGNPAGSGKNEKAIFTWFASRPIAQARAAVATALLGDDPGHRPLIEHAVKGVRGAIDKLAEAVGARYSANRPVVLDVFSGRGIIPLEAARLGATAVGLDLSPVATLAGRILADYAVRNWSAEAPLPWTTPPHRGEQSPELNARPRLIADLAVFLAEVERRLHAAVEPFYPRNPDGSFPWGYLWAISIPCDGCGRRFPLLGSLVLRHPYAKTGDPGQALRLVLDGDDWRVEVHEGTAQQAPTYSSAEFSDGRKRKGKSARCPFASCRHVHSLETVKAKGFAGEYRDEILVAADTQGPTRKVFRELRDEERVAAQRVDLSALKPFGPYSAVPDEPIPAGNVHTVMASGYGFKTFGSLMSDRQALLFVETATAIRACHVDALSAGISALVGPAFRGVPHRPRSGAQKRVDRGGQLRGKDPPGVAVGPVRLLAGQQHPPPGRIEGGEHAGGDHGPGPQTGVVNASGSGLSTTTTGEPLWSSTARPSR